ncbi:MAG: hypothetical protein NZ879_03535 [Archaeoglobaceae archaeon]|nr:hypothetical protein [Archaeoglobaceae archaeon]MDW8118039.1 hypothetical protein [Archaeoglobaceae archaeon]
MIVSSQVYSLDSTSKLKAPLYRTFLAIPYMKVLSKKCVEKKRGA